MKMQTLIDSGDTTTKTTVSQAAIYAVGKVKGPFSGKNGDFYTQSFMVGDGSITGTYERDGQTFDKQAEWVSFYKPKFELNKGDKINFEMSLREYKGKFYPQGKRIELVTKDTISGITQEDYESLRVAADVVLNALYDELKDHGLEVQAKEILATHAEQVDLIWPPGEE